jgi:hypothetical protein
MININTRLGIGFDIEHNENTIHLVDTEDESFKPVAFMGLIIKIPFISVYIGDFYEIDLE